MENLRDQSCDGADADASATHWTNAEVDETSFKDARLGRRFSELIRQVSDRMGESIHYACQGWASTKAAYRFLANYRVEEGEILSGRFAATRDRFARTHGPILLIQDTTEFTDKRVDPAKIGKTKFVFGRPDRLGRLRHITLWGMLMYSSLAVTTDGLPLGLSALKFRTRDKFKGTTQHKKKINPTRVPSEKRESVRWLESLRQSIALLGSAERCVHVGDREGDIYELFCLPHELGAHFLMRACVDRLAGEGDHTITTEMAGQPVRGLHHVELRDDKGEIAKVALEVQDKRIRVNRPIGKQKRYSRLVAGRHPRHGAKSAKGTQAA